MSITNCFKGNHSALINSLPALEPKIAFLIAQQKAEDGNTLLHTAAYLGDIRIVAYLLFLGVDKRPRNKWQQTPLLVAAKQEHIEVCKILYTPEDSLEQNDYKKLLKYVCAIPSPEAVRFAQCIVERFNESMIPGIAAGGLVDYLKIILNESSIAIGPSILQKAFLDAIRAGAFDSANVLLDHNSVHSWLDEDKASAFTMLYEATLYRQMRIACLLMQRGITCYEALHCAVRQGDKKLVKIYLKKFPVQCNSLDDGGKTPLYYAASYGFCREAIKKGRSG